MGKGFNLQPLFSARKWSGGGKGRSESFNLLITRLGLLATSPQQLDVTQNLFTNIT